MCGRSELAEDIVKTLNGKRALTISDVQKYFGWGRQKAQAFCADLPTMQFESRGRGRRKEFFYLDIVDKFLGRKIVDSQKNKNKSVLVGYSD